MTAGKLLFVELQKWPQILSEGWLLVLNEFARSVKERMACKPHGREAATQVQQLIC
jgi:hypothetical protein